MGNIFRPPCDEGEVRSAPSPAPCGAAVGRWVLAATILGSSMAFIDGTVVNVALPALQTSLGATITDVQWVVESYALTLAALMLVGGAAGDRFGRRRIFALGIITFALASVWCGLAPNVTQLIVARGAQGVGGALLVPGSLALISATFNDEQRGRAIGTWAGFTAMTAAVGPVLGGWLIETQSWRAIFFINVPLAAIVVGILWAKVPRDAHDTERSGLDWLGASLATLGLGGVIFGLIESERLGLRHPAVMGTLVGGVVLLVAFVIAEARLRAPMVPVRLFQSQSFTGANVLTLFLYAALGGALFFFPFNLIQIQGYSATAAGAALLPLILLIFLLSRWSGGLVHRYGARLPLVVGPVIAAFGFALFAVPGIGGSYWTTFFPAVVVLGLGMAIAVAPLTTTVMESVHPEQVGIASGINNAASRVAALLAVAVMGVLLVQRFQQHLSDGLANLSLPPEALRNIEEQRASLGAIETPDGLTTATSAALEQVVQLAFLSGFRFVMWTAVALALASAATALLMIESRKRLVLQTASDTVSTG